MATSLELQQDLAADGSLFASVFDDNAARKWFVKKILAHHANAPDVEAASRQALAKAKAIVGASDQAREYAGAGDPLEMRYLVAHTIYAALAVHPEVFVDRDNPALLHFVLERRLRTIFRMLKYVNRSGVFGFPVIDVWHSSLRIFARQFWQGNQGAQNELWPFVLTTQGRANRVAAVESLFSLEPREHDNDRHRVECQTAATMVLMESLCAAANPATLFAALDGEFDGYLAIDNPDTAMRRFPVGGPFAGPPLGGFRMLDNPAAAGASRVDVVPPMLVTLSPDRPFNLNLLANDDGGVQTVTIKNVHLPDDLLERDKIRTSAAPASNNTVLLWETLARNFDRGTRIVGSEVPLFHALSDARPNATLFEQKFVPIDDLQPGDVLHILGHPLLRAKIPMSPFGGERCVVVDPRPPLQLIRVTGHGVGDTTIIGIVSSMLQITNRLLTIARRVLNHCLNPALRLTPVASGEVPSADISAAAQALEARIKETIARALFAPDNEPWTAPNFFTGSWEVFDMPAITAASFPAWDRPPGFTGYRRYWALTATGTVQTAVGPMLFDESHLFVFGYWPDADANTSLAWPAEINKNFIALAWGLGGNFGATDERRLFGIPYFDDRAGVEVAMPLFAAGPLDARGDPTILKFEDMLPQLFDLARDNSEAWVIRPRVSGEAAYVNHLRTIGALPNTP